jgi:PAS domain-containing protein
MKNVKMSRDELINKVESLNARIEELEGLEKKLKKSERLLEYAQRTAHLGNWTWDIAADNFFGSREAYRIFELPPGTPMNLEGLITIVEPEDRPAVKSAIEDGLKGAVYKFEFRITPRNGLRKHVQVIGELESRDGIPVALNGTIQDITERKELENEQKRLISELQYAQKTAHLGDWVWNIAADNFVGSQESYKIFDLPFGTPVSFAQLLDMVHPEDREMVKAAMDEALHGTLYKVEFRIITRKRSLKYIQAISELESRSGKTTAVIGTIQDITEKKELENEQKRLISELQYAQQTAHLGDWVWDIAADNFSGSQESYNIFDLPLGTPVSFAKVLDMVHPEDRDMVKAAMDEAMHGALYKVEFRIITRKGILKHIQAISELERNKKGAYVIGTIQDITERKELENEQKRLITELQNALGKIKTLSGLLPICANCKRIRDERGNWSNIEKYIEKHSEAEFTHSLCPECEEKLYGHEK